MSDGFLYVVGILAVDILILAKREILKDYMENFILQNFFEVNIFQLSFNTWACNS